MKEQKTALLLLITIIISLTFAWTLQLGFDMQPCSLCLLQRFGLYVASAVLIVYLFTNMILKNKMINILLSLGVLSGIVFSLIAGLRQTYIQTLPSDRLPSCGADLETLLQIVTPLEAIKKVFEGSGECAEKVFVFLDLSLANWATVLFVVMFIYNIYWLIKVVKKHY